MFWLSALIMVGCSVAGCSSRSSGQTKEKRFFRHIPAVISHAKESRCWHAVSKERRQAWVREIFRAGLTEEQLETAFVCSRYLYTRLYIVNSVAVCSC